MYIQWGGGEHKIKAEQYEGIHSNCIHTRKLERFNHACQKCTSQWSEDTFLYVRNVPFRLPWKHADNCACHHRRPLTGMCKQISNVGGKSKADFVTLQNVYKSLLFYTDGKRRKLDFPPLVGWRTSSLSIRWFRTSVCAPWGNIIGTEPFKLSSKTLWEQVSYKGNGRKGNYISKLCHSFQKTSIPSLPSYYIPPVPPPTSIFTPTNYP